MKPLKLKMQAFGSYGEETLIDFEKVNQNLFLITGDTGAGKTTIFDAIVFALYGEASSSANKKEGVVLQSQYVDFAKEPFVELTFSEGNNADSEIYTVRRVPRHLKPITRGAGKGGQREITGSVSLIMPDGMEYPSKEADSKLQEIVGLTKSQFMQVAMIAQGEFMDLLRAKSDDKKVIFRKLFNTEMYQDIVTELGNRKREKDKEIAILKTQCQTEAVRIRIPETYELQKEMQQSRRQIEEGQTAGLADFMNRLEALCDWMKKELENAERAYQESECARTGKGEELAKAEELLKWFAQLEKAQEDLRRYEAQEPEMIRAKELAAQIRAVYEIAEKYNQYHEAETTWTDSVRALKEWEEKIPEILETLKVAEMTEKMERQKYNQEIERYSTISEKVRKSREILNAIGQKEKEITADKNAAENAEKDFAGFFPKAQDLYAFFLIAYHCRSYMGIEDKLYKYMFGVGVTGSDYITIEKFDILLTEKKMWECLVRFIDKKQERTKYQEILDGIYKHFLSDCVRRWEKNIHIEDASEAFEHLADVWGLEAVC